MLICGEFLIAHIVVGLVNALVSRGKDGSHTKFNKVSLIGKNLLSL